MNWFNEARAEYEISCECQDRGHLDESRWRMAAAQTAALIALVERLDKLTYTDEHDRDALRVSSRSLEA